MHQQNQPHISPATPGGSTASFCSSFDLPKPVKKHRGNYNCGRCGLPKKGHVCHIPPSAASTPTSNDSSGSTSRPPPPSPPSPRHQHSHLCRALSFDDYDVRCDLPETKMYESDSDLVSSGPGRLPASCMWEVLKRLPSPGLMERDGVAVVEGGEGAQV